MAVTYKKFDRTETIIMELEIKDENDAYADPATSTKVTVTDPDGTVVVNDTSMSKDAVGRYHHDYTPGADAVLGWYRIKYVATDGGRVTIQDDGFTLEA